MKKKHSAKDIARLFWTFFKIGATTFGGGYAMIPIIKDEVVERRGWLKDDELIDIIAIAESTPGPIAINVSTFVGYKKGGFLGSTFATLGTVLPSFTVIFIISLFFDAFLANQYVAYAFVGIKCAVAFLILKAGFNMMAKLDKNPYSIIMFILITGLMVTLEFLSLSFSSIFLIIAGGVLGLGYYTLQARSAAKKELGETDSKTGGEKQ